MVRSSDEFCLIKPKDDTEEYKIKLLSCFLYVPVAQLSSVTFSEIERVLAAKSVAIHYRKVEIRNISLVAGKEEYNSDNLFPDEIPCRVVVVFVLSSSKTGDYDTNPFEFHRKWKVKVPKSTQTQSSVCRSNALTERERELEAKVLEFQRQLELFKSCLDPDLLSSTSPTKNSGRGRKNRSSDASLLTRLRQSFGGQEETRSHISDHHSEREIASSSRASRAPSVPSLPPPYSDIEGPDLIEKTIFIKQVELFLNGAPLDQIETRETEDDCILSYWKMFQNGGFGYDNPLLTNGISYDDFR